MGADYPCAVWTCDGPSCHRNVVDTNPQPEWLRIPDGWYRIERSDPGVRSWTVCSPGCLYQLVRDHTNNPF